jgi:hypothetical protein
MTRPSHPPRLDYSNYFVKSTNHEAPCYEISCTFTEAAHYTVGPTVSAFWIFWISSSAPIIQLGPQLVPSGYSEYPPNLVSYVGQISSSDENSAKRWSNRGRGTVLSVVHSIQTHQSKAGQASSWILNYISYRSYELVELCFHPSIRLPEVMRIDNRRVCIWSELYSSYGHVRCQTRSTCLAVWTHVQMEHISLWQPPTEARQSLRRVNPN